MFPAENFKYLIPHKNGQTFYRVIRMLSSLAENGWVDFSTAKFPLRKYPVSDETGDLIEKILDSYPISDATRKDLRAPIRHFLWYMKEHTGNRIS